VLIFYGFRFLFLVLLEVMADVSGLPVKHDPLDPFTLNGSRVVSGDPRTVRPVYFKRVRGSCRVAPQILIVLFLIYLFDNIIQLISLRSLWYYGGW
jgi:hypothetical protein